MLTPYPLEPPPLLPPFDGPWEGPDAPLLPGRRVRLEGEGRAFGAGIGIGAIRCGGGVATRELIALEEPCVLWEGRAEGEISLDAALRFPDPDARVERSGDGTRLWLGGPAARTELLVGVLGGTVEVVEGPSGPHLRVRGNGALRLIVIAAEDEADRGRTLRTLARKGLAGLRAQRLRHTEQIDALALRTTGRDPGRDADLRALAHRLDAELTAVGGRYLLDDPVPTGGALLALGLREPVREALRAPLDDPRLLELFAQYAAWCGADEFVARHWSRAEAGALGAPGAEGARLAGLLLPVAEALGLRGSATALSARGPELEVTLEIPPAVQELWQVAPNGLEGAVTLAPALPAGWPEMTLERLRVAGTTLDLRVRRRPAGLAVACRRGHGPAIVVRLRPRLERPASGILVGDAQLPGPELTTMLDDEAEGIWLT